MCGIPSVPCHLYYVIIAQTAIEDAAKLIPDQRSHTSHMYGFAAVHVDRTLSRRFQAHPSCEVCYLI